MERSDNKPAYIATSSRSATAVTKTMTENMMAPFLDMNQALMLFLPSLRFRGRSLLASLPEL